MKYINREQKGTYGYIRKQLTFEIIKTVILFAMAVGIFLIGLLTLHTRKSLWSVIAVLALLPACRSLVGVVMLARYRSLSGDEYTRYSEYVENMPVLYENILTTSDKSFFVPVICICSGNVICYCPGKDPGNVLKEHIENVLKSSGHKANVKVFDSEEPFRSRCHEMKEKLSGNPDKSSEAMIATLKAVSL